MNSSHKDNLQVRAIENIIIERNHRKIEKEKVTKQIVIGFANILPREISKNIFQYLDIIIPACEKAKKLDILYKS